MSSAKSTAYAFDSPVKRASADVPARCISAALSVRSVKGRDLKRRVLITAATYGVLALAGAMSFSLPEALPITNSLPGNAASSGRPVSVSQSNTGPIVDPEEGDKRPELALETIDPSESVYGVWGVCAGYASADRENGSPPPQIHRNPADK